MIIWRGWGILAFLGIGLSVGLTATVAALSGTNMAGATWQGVPGFLLGGIAVHALGTHLNQTRPTRTFATMRAINHGFLTPTMDGSVVPLPLAHQPALTPDEQMYLKHMRNRHTFFFIPMQWWGMVLPIFGTAISIASLNN